MSNDTSRSRARDWRDPGKFLGVRHGATPGRVDSGADIDDVAAVHRRPLVRKRRLDGHESPAIGEEFWRHVDYALDDRPDADLVEKSHVWRADPAPSAFSLACGYSQ